MSFSLLRPKRPINAVIFSRANRTSLNQVYPFYLYRKKLADLLDFHFSVVIVKSLADIDVHLANSYDISLLQLKIPPRNGFRLKHILQAINAKKVLLDDNDSSCQCAFDLIPFIDLYIKKQTLIDLDKYVFLHPGGGRIHAGFIMQTSENSALPLKFATVPHLFKQKFRVGWNIGVDKTCHDSIALSEVCLDNKRPMDVSARIRVNLPAGLDSNFSWYTHHRRQCISAIINLSNKYRVMVSDKRLSLSRYNKELRQSKICPSPWGLGEICHRDFEIIAAGALLVKPPMEHLITNPNIYIPNETYVPVKPDFRDLYKTCRYFLENEDKRRQIAQNALNAYRAYFEKEQFVSQICNIVSSLFSNSK